MITNEGVYIASLERTNPAQDDSTYSINMEDDVEPDTLDEAAFTETPETEAGARCVSK